MHKDIYYYRRDVACRISHAASHMPHLAFYISHAASRILHLAYRVSHA